MQSATDILHPLTTLSWGQNCRHLYEMSWTSSAGHILQLNDKVYISTRLNNAGLDILSCAPINNLTPWTRLSLPPNIQQFALTTYHSQLVLLGGMSNDSVTILNELWVSDDGKSWQQSLPPMPTAPLQ